MAVARAKPTSIRDQDEATQVAPTQDQSEQQADYRQHQRDQQE